MAFEKYTVNQFRDAWFNDDRTVMSNEVFDEVYSEYIDVAGLYETAEFEKVAYVHYLNSRINSVKLFIELQKIFLNNFEIPYLPELEKFKKKWGHSIKWSTELSGEPRLQNFLRQLDKVIQKESKYQSLLKKAMEELVEMRAKRNSKDKTAIPHEKKTRGSFIRTINSLGKIGYKIDGDRTTVEELAYMIKQETENSKN